MRHRTKISGKSWTVKLAIITAMVLSGPPLVQAETYKVLFNFGGDYGQGPTGTLVMDPEGHLYGTAFGAGGCGNVFELSHLGSGWTIRLLFNFMGGTDGCLTEAGVVRASNGFLYGTTLTGGAGVGTVFELQPSVNTPWTKTVVHSFSGGHDGSTPGGGSLVLGSAGNLYGTTQHGGLQGSFGVVFKLTPSNGGWRETTLYAFQGATDGANPYAGVTLDSAGNVYGTTMSGGYDKADCMPGGCGTVYELTHSESGWVETILRKFEAAPFDRKDGYWPAAGVTLDAAGNVFGPTQRGGQFGGGIVFKIAARNDSDSLLYNFTPLQNNNGGRCAGIDFMYGPCGELVLDSAGNFYGTTLADGLYGYGSVFKLTHSGNGWIYTSLHDFTGGRDGAYPYGSPVFDSSGNLYGTASAGGTGPGGGGGVVWKITP